MSAGAGEDVSFDIALAAEYGSTVHIVDPTPRAVHHVQQVMGRLGRSSETEFVPGGAQPPSAYDVSRVDRSQLVLHEVALYGSETSLEFFPPKDSEHVSHTIRPLRIIGPEEEVLCVETRRLATLLPQKALQDLALLKLDIEGAEIEVIEDLVASGIRPKQILVEFDTLAVRDQDALSRARRAFSGLRKAGYRLVHRERLNFSFSLADR